MNEHHYWLVVTPMNAGIAELIKDCSSKVYNFTDAGKYHVKFNSYEEAFVFASSLPKEWKTPVMKDIPRPWEIWEVEQKKIISHPLKEENN